MKSKILVIFHIESHGIDIEPNGIDILGVQ